MRVLPLVLQLQHVARAPGRDRRTDAGLLRSKDVLIRMKSSRNPPRRSCVFGGAVLANGTRGLAAMLEKNATMGCRYALYQRFARAFCMIVLVTSTCVLLAAPCFARDCGMDENGAKNGKANYINVYSSKYSMWCVEETFWQSSEKIKNFFAYYDGAVAQLISLFHVEIELPIVVEITTPTGSACACGPRFGKKNAIRITGDAFTGSFVNPQTKQVVPGFWGDLLTLHETLNLFTGKVGGGGWPTDWWADHRSPFPNAMDEQVLRYVGNLQNNQTLKDAAAAQRVRFADPSQKSFDRQVLMFDNLFDRFGGFGGFSRFFRLVQEDGIRWPVVGRDPTYSGDDNHSEQLSEYVIAYLSLAFGTEMDLTPIFAESGVGTDDKKIPPYKLHPGAVKAVANAHCSIHAASAAGRIQLQRLQQGDYQHALASGGTRQSCPTECNWINNRCVAKW
jgi:hypothetical protein